MPDSLLRHWKPLHDESTRFTLKRVSKLDQGDRYVSSMKTKWYHYLLSERLRPISSGTCAAWIFLPALIIFTLLLFSPPSNAEEEKPEESKSRIVVYKDRQLLEFHSNGSIVKAYRVCLGTSPQGPKTITGDSKTPEGDYFICYKSTASRFHRFLGISYPGIEDAQKAFENGVISLDNRDSIIHSIRNGKTPPWETKMGGWVGIHGYPSENYENIWTLLLFPKPHNWTNGCIAMWNFEIEELFPKVSLGTPVLIVP